MATKGLKMVTLALLDDNGAIALKEKVVYLPMEFFQLLMKC